MPRRRRRPSTPFLFVKMNQSLGVAGGLEVMAARDQVRAQFLVVVDLAVEDDPHGTVLIGYRLVAGGEVDDAEAPHADGAAAIDVEALVVGTAMANLVAHRLHERTFGGLIEQDETGDATHYFTEFSTCGMQLLNWLKWDRPSPLVACQPRLTQAS